MAPEDATKELVVLVDGHGRATGTAEKLRVHREGLRHLAFSIFVFNSQDRLLLQKRAAEKYHSGGRWSNTCCSHPRPGEDVEHAAHRRLREELGFDCPLWSTVFLRYCAAVGNGLVENELDQIFFGRFDGEISPDPSEVEQVAWVAVADLLRDITERPEAYTVWLIRALQVLKNRRLLSL